MKLSFFIAFCLVICSSASADNTKTLICTYHTYSDSEGRHATDKNFKLTFIIDNQKHTAYIIANNASSEVSLLPAEGSVSFIEVTPNNNIMTTTVDSKGNSVHSRNTVIGGELVPSQYYGICDVKL